MKRVSLSCYSLILGVAASLAACGGSQPPIGAPGSMPLSRAIAQRANHGGSWMLPEAKGSDLIYVSDDIGIVYVYSYPQLKRVGQLELNAATEGLCVDKDGDVFVPAWDTRDTESWVYEYAHGGTVPIATLSDSNAAASSCSVDPTTGNLAVTNWLATGSDFGNVEIYPNASGSPTKYYPFKNDRPGYATYDDKGNLFVDGHDYHELAELPLGSSMFSPVTLNPVRSADSPLVEQ